MILASHASLEFNHCLAGKIWAFAEELQREIGSGLLGLVLGGGYGRGEGGTWVDDPLEKPYDDLNFFLVLQRRERLPFERLHDIAHRYSRELGIQIEIHCPLTREDLTQLPHTLMWQDLARGHKVLLGDPDLLKKHLPAYLLQPLPLIEASHLLLNRGARLLQCFRCSHNLEKSPDPDFLRRNYFKCALAIGDAHLITFQKYQTSYHDRDTLLEEVFQQNAIPDRAIKLNLYRLALQFKFLPNSLPATQPDGGALSILAGCWNTTFLHLEHRRTGLSWRSPEQYHRWSGLREPAESPLWKAGKHFLQNLRHFRLSWKHPREYLFQQIPMLLEAAAQPSSHWRARTEYFLQLWRVFHDPFAGSIV
jgi:hypothetical protein